MNLIERVIQTLCEKPLTPQQRRARGRTMKRLAPKIARKKAIALKRKASPEKLMVRAIKAAKDKIRAKLVKGKSYNDLPFAQRELVDKKLEKKKDLIQKIAKKLLPQIRKQEVERLKNKGDVKEAIELETLNLDNL